MVADSSYLFERLVKNRGELGEQEVVAPDLAVPEVINAILTQQRIFRALKGGLPYVNALFGAVESGSLQLVGVTSSLAREAYEIAIRNREAFYDCVYVALALRHRADLRTLDRRQEKVMKDEARRRERSP
jgi:predicted nucleic acid-binding protein